MIKIIAKLHWYAHRAYRRVLMYVYRPLFAACGKNIYFDPKGFYSFKNVYIGDDVILGDRTILMASRSKIIIGDKVMFGEEVVIIGGDHNTSVVGKFMRDVTDAEKRPEDDRDVIIDDDVWIGSRAIILRGVVVGRGAIVAAGAVVTKNVPPYSMVGGVPARVLKFRWDVDTILRHEEMLYPPERRYSRETLEKHQLSLRDEG